MKKTTLLFLIVCPSLLAQDSSRGFALHGFWVYGFSDRNNFSYARKGGEYDNAGATLAYLSDWHDKIQFGAQTGMREVNEGLSLSLDHVYASFQLSHHNRLWVGAVPQRFGLYGGILDIGVQRPFLVLPQSVYGPSGIVAESYKGVGFGGTGNYSSVNFTYQLYGGELVRPQKDNFERFLTDSLGPSSDLEGVGDVLGGYADVEGSWFRLGTSGYTGHSERFGRITSMGVHGGLVAGPLRLQGEFVRLVEQKIRSANSGFAELIWEISKQWETAGRFDQTKSNLRANAVLPSRQLLRHREFAAGINYRHTSYLILKASAHWIDGNFFAIPKWMEEGTSGNLHRHSFALMAGMHFTLR